MADRIEQDNIDPLTGHCCRRIQPRGLCVGVFIVMACISAGAGEPDTDVVAETPGTSYSRTVPAGWQGATRRDKESDGIPRPTSSLTIRAYEGFGKLEPFYGDEPAYGIDITAEIEECPDGEERISTLNIGGWLYEVDGNCSDDRRRKKDYEPRASGENSGGVSGETEMQCNPATWRCRIVTE